MARKLRLLSTDTHSSFCIMAHSAMSAREVASGQWLVVSRIEDHVPLLVTSHSPLPPPMPAAVVLLSGGLDSAVTAAVARSRGFEWYALSVDYGQRHRFELDAARKVARSLGAADHIVVSVDLSRIGGSALTADIAVP